MTPINSMPVAGAALTERQVEILGHIAAGLTNPEIARTLFLADETVKTHVRHILAKLHATNRSQAVAIWIRSGLPATLDDVLLEEATRVVPATPDAPSTLARPTCPACGDVCPAWANRCAGCGAGLYPKSLRTRVA